MVGPAIPEERIADAITVILSYQNSDGGMATYENTRSFHALEVRDGRGEGCQGGEVRCRLVSVNEKGGHWMYV